MAFIHSRKIGLNEFMQKIVTDERLVSHPVVLDFLGIETPTTVSHHSHLHHQTSTMDSTMDTVTHSDDSDDAMCVDVDCLGSAPSTPTGVEKAIVLGPSEKPQSSPDDFEFLKVIGKGSFGKVLLAKHRDQGKVRENLLRV